MQERCKLKNLNQIFFCIALSLICNTYGNRLTSHQFLLAAQLSWAQLGWVRCTINQSKAKSANTRSVIMGRECGKKRHEMAVNGNRRSGQMKEKGAKEVWNGVTKKLHDTLHVCRLKHLHLSPHSFRVYYGLYTRYSWARRVF